MVIQIKRQLLEEYKYHENGYERCKTWIQEAFRRLFDKESYASDWSQNIQCNIKRYRTEG